MMNALVFDNLLEYDLKQLVSKFNMRQFFEKDYYPISLFYLGMVTCRDDFSMCLPNNTMREIFVDYYNELNNYEVSKGYTKYFRAFLAEPDLKELFSGFYETYLGQFPAQAWNKINENFVRCAFYEICIRYLSRHFTFSMEVNYPSSRSDWKMTGKYHTKYKDTRIQGNKLAGTGKNDNGEQHSLRKCGSRGPGQNPKGHGSRKISDKHRDTSFFVDFNISKALTTIMRQYKDKRYGRFYFDHGPYDL